MVTPLDTLDEPGAPHEHTSTSIPTIHAQLERIVREREKAAASGRAKAVAAVLAAAALLIGIGAVGEQARQTSADVARVLVVVESLRTSVTTTAETLRTNERDHEQIRTDLREVEQKLYDARRPSRPAGGPE